MEMALSRQWQRYFAPAFPEQFSKLAVYGFGGGGREFKDIPQYTWHGGGGLEYKFSRSLGVFADAREVFPDTTANYTLVRGGVNLRVLKRDVGGLHKPHLIAV